MAAAGIAETRILLGVIGECLRTEFTQARALRLVSLDPCAGIDQQPEQERALLIAQACLDDQAAKLDLLSRVLLAGFGRRQLLHSLKPQQIGPQPRQRRSAAWSWGCG